MSNAKKIVRKPARKKGASPPKATRNTASKTKGGFTLGADSFTRISAIEGIVFTDAMQGRAAEASRKGLSAEEYRQTILNAYRKR